jgi:hypothetical protein
MKKQFFKDVYGNTAAAQVGDLVTRQVVDNFMDALPPASMRYDCSQLGEPYSHMKDPASGRIRPTFLTFRAIACGVWMCCGHCFAGENVERGENIPYV